MDDIGGPLPGIAVIVFLLVVSTILHLFQGALSQTSEGLLEKEIEEDPEKNGSDCGYLLRLIDQSFLLRSTIRFITILLGLVGGLLLFNSREMLTELQKDDSFVWIILLFLMFLVFLILAISIPFVAASKIGAHMGEKMARKLVGPVRSIILLLSPFVWFVNLFGDLLVRLFGIDPVHFEEDVTEDEIIDLVDEAQEQGLIQGSEAEMIQNIMEFGDKTARDIMTHRTNVNAIDAETPLEDAISYMLEENNTRYPVYQDSIDNIIGIILLKDAASFMLQGKEVKQPVGKITSLIRNVGFVHETLNIDTIFQSMQAKKVHLSVVIDEYGQTSGIVTMEDILEEIVGNIQDEYDDNDDYIKVLQDNSILMDGLTPLEQVEEELHISLEEEEMETLNGYLTSLLGHIPGKEDKKVLAKGYCFSILKVEHNVIQKIKVTKLQKEEEQ